MSITVAVTSTTCAVWVTTVSLPALSRAVTVTERAPAVVVSSAESSGTLPSHDASPEPPSSEQLKFTVTAAPSGTWARRRASARSRAASRRAARSRRSR